MPADPKPLIPATIATVVPAMRYRDAAAAVEWLCKAFGFEPHLVVPGEEKGSVAHAQLRFGNGMVMLGPVIESEFGRLMCQPDETGWRETQTAYVIVADADAHHARASRSGAEIVRELRDEDHGGRSYSCRDIEGHVWTFGTYDPWVRPRD